MIVTIEKTVCDFCHNESSGYQGSGDRPLLTSRQGTICYPCVTAYHQAISSADAEIAAAAAKKSAAAAVTSRCATCSC